jgi:DNA mismatch repair protein MutS2
MARCGIPLCVAAGSRIGFFSRVYTEIGDSQSIVASLSSFSAHVLVLASILEQVGGESLVLLDEVAGGTDPEQGAALATAYLEALLERGATLAATTHYEPLKRLADTDTRFQNAAVGFDVKTMAPTFRVLGGVVGPSTALAVAARFGIPDAVIARANCILPKSTHDREQLLEELSSERNAAEHARREAELEATEQRRIRLELEQERASVREVFQRQLEREYGELLAKLRLARTELEATRERLRQLPVEKAELSQLERQVDRAAHSVALGSEVVTSINQSSAARRSEQPVDVNSLIVGQRVNVASLGATATVIGLLRDGMVRVRSGSLSLRVAASDLSTSSSKPRQSAKRDPRPKTPARENLEQPRVRATPVRTQNNTLDLRGERVDAALDLLERFVDQLLRHGEPAGYVLHGHGTGALKQAVRDHARSLRHVAESGPADRVDGGDAFTLLWLEG